MFHLNPKLTIYYFSLKFLLILPFYFLKIFQMVLLMNDLNRKHHFILIIKILKSHLTQYFYYIQDVYMDDLLYLFLIKIILLNLISLLVDVEILVCFIYIYFLMFLFLLLNQNVYLNLFQYVNLFIQIYIIYFNS